MVFTPKHGSWLNLVEGFFSKMARSVLRGIRVASKDELKARILAYLDDRNREPIIHTWTYKLDRAAGWESFHGNAVLGSNAASLSARRAISLRGLLARHLRVAVDRGLEPEILT